MIFQNNEIAILLFSICCVVIVVTSSQLFVYEVRGVFVQHSLIMSLLKFGPFGTGENGSNVVKNSRLLCQLILNAKSMTISLFYNHVNTYICTLDYTPYYLPMTFLGHHAPPSKS